MQNRNATNVVQKLETVRVTSNRQLRYQGARLPVDTHLKTVFQRLLYNFKPTALPTARLSSLRRNLGQHVVCSRLDLVNSKESAAAEGKSVGSSKWQQEEYG